VSANSKIEWTDATWNPVRGCTKISPGCQHCYAETFAERFRGVPNHPFEFGFDLRLVPDKLGEPLRWANSRMIFVNSMSDLFHKNIPKDYVARVFDTMERADQHVFQVLTKRSSLLRNFVNARYGNGRAPAHIWLGVSVESPKVLVRLEHLQQTNSTVRFVSFEPLLERMGKLTLDGISWAIVGGESGHGARPIQPGWIREVRDQCLRQDVAFFFKQWGGRTPKAGGNTIDGKQWLDFPRTEPSQPELLTA
jgi:protein gp37